MDKLLSKEPETIKTEIERVEENVVEDIVNNDTTDYATIKPVPVVKTEEEIDQDRVESNKNFLATEIASREKDLEIIDDIEAKNQVDLIRSAIDPSDGLSTNEEVDQTDYDRTEHNKPSAPQLDPNVLNVMKEMIKRMSEQVNMPYDDMPALEHIPETKYTPPEFVKPNLQEILTDNATDESLLDIDEIKQETVEILAEHSLQKDILEDIMPDIFTDEVFDDSEFVEQEIPELRRDQNKLDLDVRAKVTNALVPTEVKIESDDPIDILANPNVSNIIPPISQEPYDFATEVSDDDIDFKVLPYDDNADLVPLEIDKNKIVLTDDSDVVLTEPDNMEVEDKPFGQTSEGVVALPPKKDIESVSTRNIVLKRKNPNNEIVEI